MAAIYKGAGQHTVKWLFVVCAGGLAVRKPIVRRCIQCLAQSLLKLWLLAFVSVSWSKSSSPLLEESIVEVKP